jgi:hypothetical protein
VVQLLALSLPVKMVMPLCRSLMEGRGEWRIVSALLLADGFGTVVAGGVGAWLGGVMAIAAAISVYNLAYGLFFCGIITQRIGGQIRATFVPMLSSLAFGVLALAITALLTYVASVDSTNIWQTALLILTYVAIYLSLTRFFLRDSLSEATNLVLRGAVGMWRPHRVTS